MMWPHARERDVPDKGCPQRNRGTESDPEATPLTLSHRLSIDDWTEVPHPWMRKLSGGGFRPQRCKPDLSSTSSYPISAPHPSDPNPTPNSPIHLANRRRAQRCFRLNKLCGSRRLQRRSGSARLPGQPRSPSWRNVLEDIDARGWNPFRNGQERLHLTGLRTRKARRPMMETRPRAVMLASPAFTPTASIPSSTSSPEESSLDTGRPSTQLESLPAR